MADAQRTTYESRILRIDDVAPATRAFFLDRPAGFSFLPGQFLSFLLPIGGETLIKPYTIASSPEDNGPLEIVLNLVPGGLGSGYLFERTPDDPLRFTGPWGTFFLREAPDAETVFIAGGTGIAAIRPMLRRALATGGAHPVRLHQEASTAAALLYRTELETIARRTPRFEYDPMAGSGLVDRITSRYAGGDSDRARHFFICGVGEIVPQLRDLLRRAGYERRAVQYEKW
jgi:ferredoxin-NADP reductase